MCRYGMRTRGAATIPTVAEPMRATIHAVGPIPSVRKSRNFRPTAAKEMSRTKGTKYSNSAAGTRNVVPGTPETTETSPMTRIVPAAAP